MSAAFSRNPIKGKIKPSNKICDINMNDVISFNDVFTLYVHRFGGEKAEKILEYYHKNKELFFKLPIENIYFDKKILDHLPNKKNDS